MAPVHGIARLDNPIRHYAWGSHRAIAELQGRPAPTERPEAELWMGAHPSAPSRVRRDGEERSLLDWIRAEPDAVLGPAVRERFGGEMPFLFKVLAAEQPLSIQAHPSAAQAREGFARENAAGIPLDAPHRNYRDANPKPELICALAPFEALCGFRPIAELADLLEALAPAALAEELAALRRAPDADGLRALTQTLWTLPGARRARVLAEVRSAAEARAPACEASAWIARLGAAHPDDIGALAPALLNLVRLAPGEALFLPHGELHSYLRGVGLELMANSDNVLRGGLTPKHVDVPELLRTLSFRAGSARTLRARRVSDTESVYETPAREFVLSRLEVADGRAHRGDPRGVEILLCVEGRARLSGAGGLLELRPGEAAVAPAGAGPYAVDGPARLYKAATPVT